MSTSPAVWIRPRPPEIEPPATLRKDRGAADLDGGAPDETAVERAGRGRRSRERCGDRLPFRSTIRGTSEAETPLQPGNMDSPPTSEHLQACPTGRTDYSIFSDHLRPPTQQVVVPGDPTQRVVAEGALARPPDGAVRVVS